MGLLTAGAQAAVRAVDGTPCLLAKPHLFDAVFVSFTDDQDDLLKTVQPPHLLYRQQAVE